MGYVKTHRRRDICFLIISIPFALLSIAAMVLPAYYEDLVDVLIKQNLELKEDTQQWEWFMELPIPIYFNVFIFNLTNPDEVKIGAKPIFTEVGPYTFTQKRVKQKDSLEFIDDTVSYREVQYYEYDYEQSFPHSVADNFTTVNVVFMIITQIVENVPVELPFDLEETIENVYGNSDIVDTYNIGQIVFEGVHICDPERTTVIGKLMCMMLAMLKLRFVSYLPDGSMKLSLFEYKNGKDAGVFNVNRGTVDIQKLLTINSWEGKTRTNYWSDKENNECDNLLGSREGTLFSPKVHGQNFKMFSMDICRSAELTVESIHDEFAGVGTYKYILDKNAFNSMEPEGSCYCINKTKGLNGKESCFMDGFMDLYSCFGIPALLSLPHFLYADPIYLDLVVNLKPDKAKHETVVQLEPLSGAPLTGAKRVQFNFVVRPIKLNGGILESTAKLTPTMFPLAWAEETTSLEGELLDLIQTLSYWYEFFDIFKWLLSWILGAVFAAPSFWVMFEVYTTKRQDTVTKAIEMDV